MHGWGQNAWFNRLSASSPIKACDLAKQNILLVPSIHALSETATAPYHLQSIQQCVTEFTVQGRLTSAMYTQRKSHWVA
jgi:hypothetical protein